jgi:hypothetical protein
VIQDSISNLWSAQRIFQFRLAGLVCVCFLWTGFLSGVSAAESALGMPRVYCADPQVLASAKARMVASDPSLQPALNQLLADADRRLSQKAVSVMDKNQIPPSGDKHDFISQAPYYWRDTNSPDGKYVRRDGERNPECGQDSDAGRLGSVCSGAHTLALAYCFYGDEKYAAKAAEIIRVWFLNPETRMNPNLKYGQGIPGEVEGRSTGLIGARGLADLVDAIGLLAGSSSWETNDQQGMTAWAGDYFQWLTTSKIGLGEDAASNNHGTFYDVQAVSLALFIGKMDFAREKLLQAREKRIADQIEPDGKMPRELARTLSFQYSLFNLRAEMELAALGRSAGVDLWHYQTTDGRSILKAVEFIAPYADPKREWPYKQINRPNRNELEELLLRAAAEFPESKPIGDALSAYRADDFAGNPARLYLKMAKLPVAK